MIFLRPWTLSELLSSAFLSENSPSFKTFRNTTEVDMNSISAERTSNNRIKAMKRKQFEHYQCVWPTQWQPSVKIQTPKRTRKNLRSHRSASSITSLPSTPSADIGWPAPSLDDGIEQSPSSASSSSSNLDPDDIS